MKRFNMAFPETVGEACTLMEEHPDSRAIAGGTAVGVVMKQGVYSPELLINLRPLEDELRYIREDGDTVRIGALSTLRDMERSSLLGEHFPTIIECLQEIAGIRIRNTATIGGHLSHADIHLDLPPVLSGLDAEVVVSDGQVTRKHHVDDFLRGYYDTALGDAELLTEVTLPKPAEGTRGTYVKHRYFSEVDWPCVGVAAFGVENGAGIEDVRVLLNSVSNSPVLRLEGVNETLDASLTTESVLAVADLAREQVTPSSDLRGSADYKREMAGVYTKRALEQLREE